MDFSRRQDITDYYVACPNCGRTIDVTWSGREFKLNNRECWNCGSAYIKLFHRSRPGEVHPTLLDALRPGVEAKKRLEPTVFDYKVTDHVTGRVSDTPVKGDGRDYKGFPRPVPLGYSPTATWDFGDARCVLTKEQIEKLKKVVVGGVLRRLRDLPWRSFPIVTGKGIIEPNPPG